jgi:hypothetical protein
MKKIIGSIIATTILSSSLLYSDGILDKISTDYYKNRTTVDLALGYYQKDNDKEGAAVNITFNQDIINITDNFHLGVGVGEDIYNQQNNNYYFKTYIKERIYNSWYGSIAYTGNYQIANQNSAYNHGYNIETFFRLYDVKDRENADVNVHIKFKHIERENIGDEISNNILYLGFKVEL